MRKIFSIFFMLCFFSLIFAQMPSSNIALVPNAAGLFPYGGVLPTSNFPAGFGPYTFTNVHPDAIRDNTTDPLTGFDTVVLVGICNIGVAYLNNATFKSRIENFVSNGGKLIIWDSECQNTDYSNFIYPFTSNNPGQTGLQGILHIVEENTLSSNNPTNTYYIDTLLVQSGTDAVGDANVFVTYDPNWYVDMTAQNINGVYGPMHVYADYGNGLIIYDGLDKDYMGSPTFDPTTPQGNLQRIWLFELAQEFNPDTLPGTITATGITLSPNADTNDVGASHTVTARVTDQVGSPVSGVIVTFDIINGPNAGLSGTGTTIANGTTTFTYSSTMVGTDEIQAYFQNPNPPPPNLYSNVVTKTWTTSTATPPSCNLTAVLPGPPKAIEITIQDTDTGLDAVYVLSAKNATVNIPAFTPGTTSPVVVTATKINNSKGASVALRAVDVAGNATTCDPVYTTISGNAPESFDLVQNYPNPFNPTTTIRFAIPAELEGAANVTLKIYDLSGREVKTLISEAMAPGEYSVDWDATNDLGGRVAGGVYLYRLVAGDYAATKKMTLIK